MKLKDKVAIVTGGGRGIGKAIAEAFASEGAKVVVTAARQKNEIEQVASKIGGTAILADFSNKDGVHKLIDSVVSDFGRIDILVNNAARGMKFVNESFMTEPKPFLQSLCFVIEESIGCTNHMRKYSRIILIFLTVFQLSVATK